MDKPNFLQQEIAQIERQLAEKRAALEQQKEEGEIVETPHEKETLREVMREQYAQPAPAAQNPTSSQADSGQAAAPPPHIDPPSYLSEELKNQVQALINIAFTSSLANATKQARATNNGALIDAFHDALVDELYNYLIEKGKLKKI